jgi:hypothetical protein
MAVVLLGGGAIAAGLIVLAVAIGLLTLFAGGVRRHRDAPAVRRLAAVRSRLTGRARLGLVAVGVRSRGALELMRIRQRRYQLRNQLQASLAPLGEAYYRGEQPRTEALKSRTRALELALREVESEEAAALAAAHHQIASERMTAEPTEAFRRSGRADD